MSVTPIDLSKLRVFPLAERKSLTRVEEILIEPDAPPKPCSDAGLRRWSKTRRKRSWPRRASGAAVMLIYGAHLLRNGAAKVLERMMAGGWLTHLATNGAGTIHDWEYAWLGASTESVQENVATGTLRHLARDGDQYSSRAHGRRARRPGLRPGVGPVHP